MSLGVLWLGSARLRAAEANLPTAERSPAKLVEAALKSELEGPSEPRQSLLKQALALDPDFAPARWQLGFVRWDDQWLSLDEVAKRAASDPTLAEYRKRRDALIDTADNHRELARWCRKNKLADEERVHWAKVLEFDINDAETHAALGLQLYDGRLLTQQQIDAAKKQAGEAQRAMRHWQPQMVKWRKAIVSGGAKERRDALKALEKLSDREAIAALEVTFAEDRESEKSDELNLRLIETVGRMSFPEATQVLLRRAVLPDSKRVREAACDELKKRPMFAYVPLLISWAPLEIDVDSSFGVYLVDGLIAVHDHVVTVRSSRETRVLNYRSLFTSIFSTGATIEFRLGAQLAEVAPVQDSLRTAREEYEKMRRKLTDRVQVVLARATEFETDGGPDAWQQQWEDYSESYRPKWSDAPVERHELRWRRRNISCFPAGTPIATVCGARPIESIRVGDRVLAQSPVSGELVYTTVQGLTLRPASSLVKVKMGSGSLSATRGHPFWIDREGWVMAKHLKAGQLLHGVYGAVEVSAVEESPAREAYNLVVSDFGTYFVGDRPVLVHDNTPFAAESSLVPGLVTNK
jgi:hypothetical protein